jgi:Ser/Thr protein kinase RdoA (MazF antagonist)
MLQIPAVHTVFHKDTLFEAMILLYDMGSPLKSRFVSNGLNDTYAVDTDTGKFILRIYKHLWRAESDIRFELDLLTYLKDCGLPVSYPIPRRDGEWLTELNAPEGTRYAVLFSYADGVGKLNVDTSRAYGSAIAQLHHAMDHYEPKHQRFELDAVHLLDEPLQTMIPFLQHRPNDLADVQEIASRLKVRLTEATGGTYDWGVCHGDLHGWNVFHSDDGSMNILTLTAAA